MVAFISGFLVIVAIITMCFKNLTYYSEVIEQLVTVGIGCLLLAFVIYQSVKHSLIWIKLICHRYACKEKVGGYCLLIEGEWGSGKTTLYEDVFRDKKHIKDIKISCFSANKAELINQLGQESFLWKVLSLNGTLSKLLENNWRAFMPKRRVVVFDDLERLHSGENNYVDLIGIIDYLKTSNKCDIILLASFSDIKNEVFLMYMERIVDDVCMPPVIAGTNYLYKLDLCSCKFEKNEDEILSDGVYQTEDKSYYQLINNKKNKLILKQQCSDDVKMFFDNVRYQKNAIEHHKLNDWFDSYLYPNVFVDKDKHKKYSIAYYGQMLERFKFGICVDSDRWSKVTMDCYCKLMKEYKFSKFKNIRVIRNVMSRLNDDVTKIEASNGINEDDIIGKEILISILANVVYDYVRARVLFYIDYNLFTEARKYPYDQKGNIHTNETEYHKNLEARLGNKFPEQSYFYVHGVEIHNFFESKLAKIAVKGEYEKRAFGSLNAILSDHIGLLYKKSETTERPDKDYQNKSLYPWDDSEEATQRINNFLRTSKINEVRAYILGRAENLLTYLRQMGDIQISDINYYMMLAIVAKENERIDIANVIIEKISLHVGHLTAVDNLHKKYVLQEQVIEGDFNLNIFILWFLKDGITPDSIKTLMNDGVTYLHEKVNGSAFKQNTEPIPIVVGK